MLPLALVQAE